MHRNHRFGHRFAQRKSPILKSIWLIGMGILLLTQHVWPGILILIGISIVFSVLRTPRNNEFPEEPSFYPSQPEPVAFNPEENLEAARSALPPQPVKPTPVVDSKPAPAGELPANCPRCGAPVKSNDIKWNGKQAACSYCGSNLIFSKK